MTITAARPASETDDGEPPLTEPNLMLLSAGCGDGASAQVNSSGIQCFPAASVV